MDKLLAVVLIGYAVVSANLEANAVPYTFHPATYQDCDDDSDEACEEDQSRRYRSSHYRYRYYRFNDEAENPAYKLDRLSSWPAEREEFSDYLFKD